MKNKERMCFGIIIGTRAYFNSELAKDVRKQLLRTLADEGYDYVILPEDATPTGSSSIETREDGLKCAELFRQNRDRIDGIIVSLPNFGFEIGIINAISVADLNVPILVQACDDENDKVDLDSRRDAFCGKISVCNNPPAMHFASWESHPSPDLCEVLSLVATAHGAFSCRFNARPVTEHKYHYCFCLSWPSVRMRRPVRLIGRVAHRLSPTAEGR